MEACKLLVMVLVYGLKMQPSHLDSLRK